MSQEASSTNAVTGPPTTNSTSSTAAAKGPGAPGGGGAGAAADMNATSVSSVADLKEQAPKVYNAMMQGIAMDICNSMKKHQDHLKQMMDEARRNS